MMEKITDTNKLEEGKVYLWISEKRKIEWVWFINKIDFINKKVSSSMLYEISGKLENYSDTDFSFKAIMRNIFGEDGESRKWELYLLNEKEVEKYQSKLLLKQL